MLDDLNFSIFADWPGAIHEGGGQAISFIDERADDSQRQALAELVQGQAGGPWGVFAGTYQLEGPVPLPYRVDVANGHSHYRVGDAAELRVERIRNP